MIEEGRRGPGAVSPVSLTTSLRRGDSLGLSPSHLPPWHDGAGQAADGYFLLRLLVLFLFKPLKN